MKLRSQILGLKPDRSEERQRSYQLNLPLQMQIKRPTNKSKLLSILSCVSLSYSGSTKNSMVNSGQLNFDSAFCFKENELLYLRTKLENIGNPMCIGIFLSVTLELGHTYSTEH